MDDSEAREILRAHGEEPPARGRLNDEWKARATHYADQDDASVDVGDTGAGEPPAPVTGVPVEAQPRRVRVSRPALRDRVKGHQRKRRPKRKHPRIPVDSLISSAWAALGGLAGNIDPPLGRCLVMQAPVSGLILEDLVKDTAVDRVLQPIARAEEKAEKALALFAPPAIVAALEVAQQLPEQQRKTREAILIPLLERSMVLWVRIAGDKIGQQLERAAEEEPAREKARQLLAMIFGPPAGTAPPAPEDDAAARAQSETVGV